MVGEYCSAPHLSWTEAPLEEDEVFYIEMGGVRHRYHSPLSRCVYVGNPPEPLVRTTAIIREGLEAVLDAVRPGVLCEDLAAAWKGVVTHYGIEKDLRIGYPVGHRLSADVGRTHLQPASRRYDGHRGEHDLPLHTSALDGQVRAGRE